MTLLQEALDDFFERQDREQSKEQERDYAFSGLWSRGREMLQGGYKDVALVDYVNWKGRRAWRLVYDVRLWFGETVYHPQPQHIFRARDAIKANMVLDFALSGVKAWVPVRDCNPDSRI